MKQRSTTAYLGAVICLLLVALIVLLLSVRIPFNEIEGAVVYPTTAHLRLREKPVTDVTYTDNVLGLLDPTHAYLVLDEEKNSYGWWLKLRDEATGREGWAACRYLRATPSVRMTSRDVPFGRIAGDRLLTGFVDTTLGIRRHTAEISVLLTLIFGVIASVFAWKNHRSSREVRFVVLSPEPVKVLPQASPVNSPAGAQKTNVSSAINGHYADGWYAPKIE